MLSHWTFIGWVQSVECTTGFACLVQSSSSISLFTLSPAESQWCHHLIMPKQACSSFKNITNPHYVQSVELKYYFPGKGTWRYLGKWLMPSLGAAEIYINSFQSRFQGNLRNHYALKKRLQELS